ncbi:MAG: MFS transporter [Promethearchaeota archaeon]
MTQNNTNKNNYFSTKTKSKLKNMKNTKPNNINELDISKVLKLNVKETLFIGLGFMSAMIAWSFYNFKIPIVLNGIDGVRQGLLPNTPFMEVVGGFIMTLDNIIAILLQPYFGELSDRLHSKYGRRTPFMIIGLPIAVFCLFLLPFLKVVGLFIGVIFVFNLAMAFYRAPIISLMPDKTPKQLVSKANSYISLMGGFGTVFGLAIPFLASLMPGGNPNISSGPYPPSYFAIQDFWGFFLTGIFMLSCLILFLWKVREAPTGKHFFKVGNERILVDVFTQKIIYPSPDSSNDFNNSNDSNNSTSSIDSNNSSKKEKPKFFEQWREIHKDEDKSAFWILMTVFSYLFGFNAVEFSFGRFAGSYLGVSEKLGSSMLALIPIMLIAFAIPAGAWATKYGRLRIMKIGLLVQITSSILIIISIIFIRIHYIETGQTGVLDLIPVVIMLMIGGIGYGLTHINALPVVWQLAPKTKIGAYTGVYYMISALGSILSPIFMSGIYAIIKYFGGNQWVALFPYFLTGLVVGFILIQKVKRGDVEPLSSEELEELRALYADE